jgi:hypothetical protein
MEPKQKRVDKLHRLEDELKKKLAFLLPTSDREPIDHATLIVDRVKKLVKEADLTPLEVSDLLGSYVRKLDPGAWSKYVRKLDPVAWSKLQKKKD